MRPIIVMAAMLGITACASTPATTTAMPFVPPSPTVSNTILTRSELQSETQTAYAAIERLRPLFLATGPSGADVHGIIPHLNVFIDGYFVGDADVLKTIPASDVESVQRLQPTMAYATLGGYHAGEPVLMVSLRCKYDC